MKIFEKIEALINRFLVNLFIFISNLFSIFIPQKIKYKYEKFTNEMLPKIKNTTRSSLKTYQTKLTHYIVGLTKNTTSEVKKIIQNKDELKSSLKMTIKDSIVKIKSFKIGHIKTKIKEKVKNKTNAKINISGLKLEKKTDPKIITLAIAAILLTTVFSIKIYETIQAIQIKLNPEITELALKDDLRTAQTNSRAPASRPNYKNGELKQIIFEDFKIPTLIGDEKKVRPLTISFTIESSNRYIIEFFKIRPYLLQDQVYNSLEPILPTFSLEEEGKRILKDKLIKEINILIEEKLKIKGEIKEVYVHSINAG